MDTLVSSIGGYDSGLFWLLVIGCLLIGQILIKFVSPFFVALQVFGAVLLFAAINHAVQTTPNLPSWSQYIPLLFAAALISGVFRGMARAKHKQAQQTDNTEEDTKCP